VFPILAAVLLSPPGTQTVSLEPVKGHGRVSLAVPSGYRVVTQTPTLVLMTGGTVRITLKWQPGIVTEALSAAIKASLKPYQKEGRIVGPISIGRFQGQLLRFPMTKGLDLHSVMVSGKDMFSVSYFDMALPPSGYPKAIASFQSIIHSAHLETK
jgi:hypothetical protein